MRRLNTSAYLNGSLLTGSLLTGSRLTGSLLVAALLSLSACSDDPDRRPPGAPDVGAIEEDAAAPDSGDGDGDGGDPDTGATCSFVGDCGEDQNCIEGSCVDAPACEDLVKYPDCVEALEAYGQSYGLRAVCRQGSCQVACLDDGECAPGDLCTDDGRCRPFTGEITGVHPGGEARAALQAGVSNVALNYPMGLSLGGYGTRAAGGDNGPYAGSLRRTHGMFHGLFARAIALDNGERQMVLMRLPMIFTSMALHEAVARRLQADDGRDWRDSLVISSTHTHSGPARTWHLPTDAAIDLGALGTDNFHQQIFDWLVESAYQAARQALDGIQPARFGWEIVESFDTDDAIASDRWKETPPFDDNRLLLMRVDDADGVPLAVGFSLGIHGTYNESDYFTGDVIAGMERALEARLGQAHERFVPALFFNENGGSMSPRGGRHGHKAAHLYESIGVQLADRAMPSILALATDDDVDLGARTLRFPISYERLGYDIGQWARGGETVDGTLFHGGVQCSNGSDEDYETHAEPFRSFCLPVHMLTHNRPLTLFYKSQISALNLDGLTIVTLPGEGTMELGWQVLRDARDAAGIDPASSFVWSYTQDHQFYLTPTNLRGELPTFPGISLPMAPDEYPDFTFSWLQGGYEASMSVWGLNFGDYIAARAVEAVRLLREDGFEPTTPAAKPTQYTPVTEMPFEVKTSDPSVVGTIVEDVPARVERLQSVEFAWIGGDPGAEMPQAPRVVLERDAGDASFEPVRLPSTREYDNFDPVMLTRLRTREGAGGATEHVWVVRWEETKRFATGDYRFRVEGHYLAEGESTPVAYQATSATFSLVPTDDLLVTGMLRGDVAAGTLGYPAAERLSFERTDEDPGRVTGSLRMRHPEVPTGVSDPLVADEDLDAANLVVAVKRSNGDVWRSFSGADVALATMGEEIDGRQVPVTRWEVDLSGAPAGATVEVSVVDNHGNTGAVSF